MPDLGWLAQLLGAFATAHFAATVFSGRGRDATQLGLATAAVLGAVLLGAGWAVHPAAGLLLAFMVGWMDGGSRRWERHLPLIGVALFSACLLMLFGAAWLRFPLAVILLITAFNYLSRLGRPQHPEPAQPPAALPEGMTGTPAQRVNLPEGVPVTVPSRPTPSTAPGAVTAQAPLQDMRLPAEARALLAAIDLRTIEAQKALAAQGQTGTQAAYEARAIREEYAPAAVQAYLKLPPTRADTMPIDGQKTGRDLLLEQLELLLNAAQNLVTHSTYSGGQELLANARFLREKFGQDDPQDANLKLK